jgi:hypothetical protein
VPARRPGQPHPALVQALVHAKTLGVRIGSLGPQRLCELHPFRLRPVPPLETAPSALLAGCSRHLALRNALEWLVNRKGQIPDPFWGARLPIRTRARRRRDVWRLGEVSTARALTGQPCGIRPRACNQRAAGSFIRRASLPELSPVVRAR